MKRTIKTTLTSTFSLILLLVLTSCSTPNKVISNQSTPVTTITTISVPSTLQSTQKVVTTKTVLETTTHKSTIAPTTPKISVPSGMSETLARQITEDYQKLIFDKRKSDATFLKEFPSSRSIPCNMQYIGEVNGFYAITISAREIVENRIDIVKIAGYEFKFPHQRTLWKLYKNHAFIYFEDAYNNDLLNETDVRRLYSLFKSYYPYMYTTEKTE